MSSATRNPHEKAFSYHAQAIGLAASLTKPCCEIIPGQAATSLSQTGGESYSTVKNFNWKGLITFDEASSYVTGSADHGAYNTLTTSTIRNLNIANMVQAEIVVARITSKHERGKPEGEITFAGSMIRNLTIAGETVNVSLDPTPFSQLPTFDQFVKGCGKTSVASNAWVGEDKDVATASLVSGGISCKAGSTKSGYVVTIPEFGTIYVAQVLMKRGYRSLDMLRFALGCPIAGTLTAAGGGTNGGEYFP
jgi:hypothetical protein